ncbi:WD40 repeat domain-containing protein [Geotalea sp. SG265]|uniref:WD40 repeat domain-containing protein n=1 Tax=Geotalea sp. SG265 TaxID=2922867 RepID=UPI001FAEB692|nr:WD40 repeat domain-containing protein [Geotalea sp. SG265]
MKLNIFVSFLLILVGGAVFAQAGELSLSPDKKTVVFEGKGKTILAAVDTGEVKKTLPGRSPKFLKDGRIVMWTAKKDEGARVVVYSSKDGSLLKHEPFKNRVQKTGSINRSDPAWGMYWQEDKLDEAVVGLWYTISPDEKYIAVGTDYYWGVFVFDINSGDQVFKFGVDTTHAFNLKYSPDGKILAFSVKGDVGLYDASTGKKLMGVYNADPLETFEFSPDGKLIATGHPDKIKIWDAATGLPKASFPLVVGTPTSIHFSPDGKFIGVKGRKNGAEGGIAFYDLQGKLVKEFENNGLDHMYGDFVFMSDAEVTAISFDQGRGKMKKNAKIPNFAVERLVIQQ